MKGLSNFVLLAVLLCGCEFKARVVSQPNGTNAPQPQVRAGQLDQVETLEDLAFELGTHVAFTVLKADLHRFGSKEEWLALCRAERTNQHCLNYLTGK